MSAPPATVDVLFEERYWYPDDGGAVWLSGYNVVDPQTGEYLARDAPRLRASGLRVVGLAGATHQDPGALESDAAAPGQALVLRRDAGNEHDPNAIAVDLPGGPQLGWVPRELAAELAEEIDSGETWSALILRERRASPRDPRSGVTMLLARASGIVLRDHGS
jgi:HIRAN domain